MQHWGRDDYEHKKKKTAKLSVQCDGERRRGKGSKVTSDIPRYFLLYTSLQIPRVENMQWWRERREKEEKQEEEGGKVRKDTVTG